MDAEAFDLLNRVLEYEVELEERKILIIDGMPRSGKSTLAESIAADLGVIVRLGATQTEGAYNWLRETLEFPDRPLIVDEFHLTAAVFIAEKTTDLTAMQWSLLDNLLARRETRILCLVDTPFAIEKRFDDTRPRDRNRLLRNQLGRRLQLTNQSLRASSVGLKGTYTLKQFLDPETGERTEQYKILLQELRAGKG